MRGIRHAKIEICIARFLFLMTQDLTFSYEIKKTQEDCPICTYIITKSNIKTIYSKNKGIEFCWRFMKDSEDWENTIYKTDEKAREK